MGHDWDCPKKQVMPKPGCLSMHKNQRFITIAINIFYSIKFISKCEILQSFIYNTTLE